MRTREELAAFDLGITVFGTVVLVVCLFIIFVGDKVAYKLKNNYSIVVTVDGEEKYVGSNACVSVFDHGKSVKIKKDYGNRCSMSYIAEYSGDVKIKTIKGE